MTDQEMNKELEQIAESYARQWWEGKNHTFLPLVQTINSALTEALALVERERDELKGQLDKAHSGLVCFNLVANIQDTCRSRDFMKRPVDEAVIEMAQALDALTNALAPVERERDELKLKLANEELHRKELMECWQGSEAQLQSRIQQLEAQLATPAIEHEGCEWVQDEDSMWKSGCGQSREDLNQYWKFCPYCGKPIKEGK